MTNRKKTFIRMGGRNEGKTLQMQEMVRAAIERGEKIYLPEAPSIAEDDVTVIGRSEAT